jgi:NADH-quinone oxidoreductase subunit H
MNFLKNFLDSLILSGLFGGPHDPATWPLTQLVYVVAMFVCGAGLTTFGAVFAGMVIWAERRIAGRMQSRIGPNRVGPAGLLQFLADALKLIVKEDLIPGDADHILFRIAPYFVMAGFVCTFVVLPFGYHLSATDMNVGLFYVVSITALVVVGVLISGWASNSKWALFGGIRAAAQVVSYEIPAGLVILLPIMMSGSLSLHEIIRAQGGWPWDWYAFQTPMGYVAFFILFTSLLAEGNRTPFDLPEAESELVAGYNTEYSGMRFGLFFLAEWGNLWVMSALLTTLFLGGWQVPWVSTAALHAWEMSSSVPTWFYVASFVVFGAKTIALVLVVIWIRWTFPRIRVDQMMSLCWKYLVPAGIVLVLATALTEWVSSGMFPVQWPETVALADRTAEHAIDWGLSQAPLFSARGIIHFVFFAVGGLLPLVIFLRKTFQNIRIAGDRVDMTNW